MLISMMLEDMLGDLGHCVLDVAQEVDVALELIRRRADEIDAAVVDANLAGQSAAPVAAALRVKGIPFIIASGYEGDQLKSLGFDEAYLRKPYRSDEVDGALKGLFDRRPRGR